MIGSKHRWTRIKSEIRPANQNPKISTANGRECFEGHKKILGRIPQSSFVFLQSFNAPPPAVLDTRPRPFVGHDPSSVAALRRVEVTSAALHANRTSKRTPYVVANKPAL